MHSSGWQAVVLVKQADLGSICWHPLRSPQVAVYTGSSAPGFWYQIDLITLKYFKSLLSQFPGILCGSSPVHTNSHYQVDMVKRHEKTVLDKSDSDFRGRQKLNFSQRLWGTNSKRPNDTNNTTVCNIRTLTAEPSDWCGKLEQILIHCGLPPKALGDLTQLNISKSSGVEHVSMSKRWTIEFVA